MLCWFLFFIFVHVTLVFITGARQNLNYMWAGVNDNSWDGLLIWGCAMVLVIVTWWLASPFTIRHARLVQKIGQTVVGSIMGYRGMVGTRRPSTRTRDLVVFLAQWHAAKLRRV